MTESGDDLQRIYAHRFDESARERETVFWDVFFAEFLAKRVGRPAVVLDVAAGSCGFINRVEAPTRYALDLNPDVERCAAAGVQVLRRLASDTGLEGASVDLAFSSNFFEHLPSSDALLDVLGEVHRVLVPGGRLLVLMPNLAAVGGRYFDYLDHRLPLTDRSLREAVGLSGFRVTELIPRTIPYARNSAGVAADDASRTGLTGDPAMFRRALRAYLRVPAAWRLLGGQMFLSAEKD